LRCSFILSVLTVIFFWWVTSTTEIKLSEKKLVPVAVRSSSPNEKSSGFIFKGRYPMAKVDLLALLPSRITDGGFSRRESHRRFLSLVDTTRFRLGYYFLLSSRGKSESELVNIYAENKTWGDLLFANDELEDYNMVGKVWTELNGLVSHYKRSGVKEPSFWAKFDDDAVVLWDRFVPALLTMPHKELVWCNQGSGALAQDGGFSGMFCNGPYLFSWDVARHIGSDLEQRKTSVPYDMEAPRPGYNDDYCT